MMTQRSLRSALLTTFHPPFNVGGDGVAVQNPARALVRRGHAVTVVHDTDAYQVLQGGAPPRATPEPTAYDDGVQVVSISTRRPLLASLVTQQLGFPGLKRRAIRAAMGTAFDVVHYHNVSLIGGPGLTQDGPGVRLYTAHEHWLVCPTHVLWRDNREPCDSRHCFTCTLRHGRPPQLWRYTPMLHRALGRMDAIIAQSGFSRTKHAAFGLMYPMQVLPPIVADAQRPGDTPVPPRDPSLPPGAYVLFAGRLEAPVGVDDFLRMFSRPGTAADAMLVIAGDGTARAAWERSAAGNTRRRFIGAVDRTRFNTLFANFADIAAPALRARGLTATVFVVSGRVGRDNQWRAARSPGIPQLPLMDWQVLGGLAAEGFENGAHTCTHPHLPTLSAAAIEDEIAGSAVAIEAKLGMRNRAFADPYGEYNATASSVVSRELTMTCTTDFRAVSPVDSPARLPRLDCYYFRHASQLYPWRSFAFRSHLRLRGSMRRLRQLLPLP